MLRSIEHILDHPNDQNAHHSQSAMYYQGSPIRHTYLSVGGQNRLA